MSLNAHQQYLLEEFADDYKEHNMPRRELLRRALLITGSIPLAATSLIALGCGGDDDDEDTSQPASSATGAPAAATSPTTLPPTPAPAQDVTYKGPAKDMKGYLAVPEKPAGAKSAGLIVIHENRGLVDHTKDVARRFAKEGFVALAVDLVSRYGGSTSDTTANMGFLSRGDGSTTADQHTLNLVADLQASVDYLKGHSSVRAGSIGVVGYCFGGGYTWELAVASPDIKAAVPYYGSATRVINDLGKTNAAVLAIYGANDTRITGQAEEIRTKLTEAKKTFEIKIYDGANHAFFNDTGTNYNATAATDAWAKTLAWFRQHLGA